MKANFDTIGFFNNFFTDNPSVVARFANLISVGMNCQASGKLFPLPKIIMVVPEDNLIRLLCGNDRMKGFSKPMSQLLNFIMTHHDCSIAMFKELLAACSLKHDFPQILWIQPPEHVNFHNNSL